MNTTVIVILLGLGLGAAVVAVLSVYFVVSRPYRQRRNRFVIILGYVLIGTLFLGSILLLNKATCYFNIQVGSVTYYSAVWAFIVSALIGMILILRSESQWRKAVGLDRKSLRAANPPRVGAGVVIVAGYSAFLAGGGTVLLLGPRLFRGIPFGLAVCSTVSSLFCAVFCGYVLTKNVRKQQSEKG
jgi:drug/metabolite transporter (DMT)-like permease